jgi:NAD(P)-dependent dehydrogenase (short-subunit alcohol dehydrogenase family)
MTSIFRDGIFEKKVAFLTGGSSGIGLRIAEVFAQMGAAVTLTGRSEEKLAAASAGIVESGGKADSYALDVRDYSAVQKALEQTAAKWGPIDFLICAAAGNFPAPALGISPNGFKAVVDIDLMGTFHTCRAAHPYLRKPGSVVINITANHGHTAIPLQAHVCAAKAGVDLLTKVLALEWGPEGIRVLAISPGPIDGTEGMRRLAPTPEARAAVEHSVPLKRMGSRDDIAALAVFLCSDAASYITGSIHQCDGGSDLTGPRLVSDTFSS